jgi:tetratricopeptide (TPR) repeat protein
VSYPDAAVAAYINDSFVPLQIDTTDERNANLVARFHQIWTPDIRVLTDDGTELDGWQGYLPPSELLPRLMTGRARALARLERNDEARDVYEDVLRRFPRSFVAAEAAYWCAVLRYKSTHNADDLLGGWTKGLARYPDSRWRVAQSFTEAPLRW